HDADFQPLSQSTEGKPECRRCLAFAGTGMDDNETLLLGRCGLFAGVRGLSEGRFRLIAFVISFVNGLFHTASCTLRALRCGLTGHALQKKSRSYLRQNRDAGYTYSPPSAIARCEGCARAL